MSSEERRCHPRAPLLATAVLVADDRALGSYKVINASAGGLLLAGEPPAEATSFTVLFRLPAGQSVRATGILSRRANVGEGLLGDADIVKLD
jgi:hypothetical protein